MTKKQVENLIDSLEADEALRARLTRVLWPPPASVDGRFEAILKAIQELRADSDARMVQLRQDFNARADRADARAAATDARIEQLRQDFNARFEQADARAAATDARAAATDARIEHLREDFNRGMAMMAQTLDRRLSAIGERWGTEAEGSFRRAMEDVIRTRFGGDVRKWRVHDAASIVRPFPSDVEVDLLVRNGKHLLLEVKSSATDSDVVALWRAGQVYARETGTTPDLAMVTPAPTKAARDVAQRLGITLYTELA